MKGERNYTYTVLRYVHDVATGEFINIGVVCHAPAYKYFDAKFRHTYGRLSCAFPDIDADGFKRSVYAIEARLKKLAVDVQRSDLFPPKGNALTIALSVLPKDDSSLQWSSLGGGVTHDPAESLEYLFERLVTKYDQKQRPRRPDEDVWRSFRNKLEDTGLEQRLVEKTIRSEVDEVSFKHAWKNGFWHCYAPLSFDLADADHIKGKARGWTGHLAAVQSSPDRFKTYFIVGEPSDQRLSDAFHDAIAILRISPVEVDVFTEQQTDDLVSSIREELESHVSRGRDA